MSLTPPDHTSTMQHGLDFSHSVYSLLADGKLARKADAAVATSSDEQNAEHASVIEAVTNYVQRKMRFVTGLQLDILMSGAGLLA